VLFASEAANRGGLVAYPTHEGGRSKIKRSPTNHPPRRQGLTRSRCLTAVYGLTGIATTRRFCVRGRICLEHALHIYAQRCVAPESKVPDSGLMRDRLSGSEWVDWSEISPTTGAGKHWPRGRRGTRTLTRSP